MTIQPKPLIGIAHCLFPETIQIAKLATQDPLREGFLTIVGWGKWAVNSKPSRNRLLMGYMTKEDPSRCFDFWPIPHNFCMLNEWGQVPCDVRNVLCK